MIFFGKKNAPPPPEDEPEIDPVRFLGAVNGKDANLAANARLADAGLIPAKELVTDALARRADVIRVDPKGSIATVAMMVDGIAYPGGKLQKMQTVAITQMLKLLAGLDIKERKSQQEGGINAEFNGKKLILGIQSVPVNDGERLTIRVYDPALKLETPAEVGMSTPLREKIRDLGSKPGILIVAGPPMSGLTTAFFAAARGLDSYTVAIFSLGDLKSRKLLNITPFEANPGDSLGTTIDRIVRVEAEALFIADPVRDPETAKTLVAKHSQLSFLIEMPAKDAASALAQFSQWVGDAEAVGTAVKGVLSQKLIRTLCSKCKQAYRPSKEFIKKAGLPPDVTTLYRRPAQTPDQPEPLDPCPKCDDTGYIGRTAMFELIEVTDPIREVLKSGGDPAAIKVEARKQKMLTLQQDGLRLIAEGKTSLEELQRVFKTPGS